MNLQSIPFDNELLRYWVKTVCAAQSNPDTLLSRLKYLPFETAAQRHDALHNIAQNFASRMLYRGGVYRVGAVDVLKRDDVPLLAETPAALVINMPSCQAMLLAPWRATNGCAYNGALEIVLFVGEKVPKDKNQFLRFRVRRNAEGKWCDLQISAPPAAKFMTDESQLTDAEKEGLYSFLEIFVNNGNLMEVGKLMLAIIKEVYATNDQRAKAVAELSFLFSNET